eukprot:CAMPEP_0194048236 /NCGR_PEP_ID=MMETSP0009_2-20130614/26802_1 /TAXON_ID=210454 /ORGANISM="Grammatophora oceanica, Strain CCMP 410" /LENGTH=481 /DNA_ID=CAMNT_0038694057 /DNA_START=236 /DNA_END=1681 /DNA_ORIENTATION=+
MPARREGAASLTPSIRSLLGKIPVNDDDDDDASQGSNTTLDMSIIRSLLAKSSSGLSLSGDGASVASEQSSIRSSRREHKSVKFTGLDSPSSSFDESVANNKSPDELAAKINKYKLKLKQAEIDLSAEKTIRKKKERNLVKLAKELNRRATKQSDLEKEVEKLKAEISALNGKLVATRTEMEERTAALESKNRKLTDELEHSHRKHRDSAMEHDSNLSVINKVSEESRLKNKALEEENAKLQGQNYELKKQLSSHAANSNKSVTEYKVQLAEADQRYRDACTMHDSQMNHQAQKHSVQTEELRRDILTAKLESDKLRAQLASLEMAANPGAADEIASRALVSSFAPRPKETNFKDYMKYVWAGLLVLVVAFFIKTQLYTRDSVCSPVPPGGSLKISGVYSAPWWAPGPVKSIAFNSLCYDYQRTIVHWAKLPSKEIQLTVADEDGNVLMSKKSYKTLINADVVRFVDKKGKIETLRTPWSQ